MRKQPEAVLRVNSEFPGLVRFESPHSLEIIDILSPELSLFFLGRVSFTEEPELFTESSAVLTAPLIRGSCQALLASRNVNLLYRSSVASIHVQDWSQTAWINLLQSSIYLYISLGTLTLSRWRCGVWSATHSNPASTPDFETQRDSMTISPAISRGVAGVVKVGRLGMPPGTSAPHRQPSGSLDLESSVYRRHQETEEMTAALTCTFWRLGKSFSLRWVKSPIANR